MDGDTANLRAMLTRSFSDDELKDFCFDRFRSVYDNFNSGMTKTAMIRLLIDYCDRRMELPILIELLKKERPWLFDDAKTPSICLKLIKDEDYSDDIVFKQPELYIYGVSLQNTTKGSIPAENIDIRIEFHWRGNDLTYAPRFFTYDVRRVNEGWTEQRSKLTSDQPAILVYHGDRDRCVFGHPRDWHEFSLLLREKISGYFLIRYYVSSISPLTNNEGELKIIMR